MQIKKSDIQDYFKLQEIAKMEIDLLYKTIDSYEFYSVIRRLRKHLDTIENIKTYIFMEEEKNKEQEEFIYY